MNTISRIRTGMIGALSAIAASGCAVNPVTGERELSLISEGQEIEMGREAARQVETSLGLVEDEGLQQYVSDIGLELASMSERPDLPWEFHVVDDPSPNAFALPGGFIFVTRGLLSLMNSEAELAAVLGHEIGHVTAKHSVNQLSRAQLAELGLQLGSAVSPELRELSGLANTGLSLLFLKYGRDDERQADELGFDYMLAQRYDPREMEDVFATLLASGELAGTSAVPTWLASHPSEPERIEAVRRRIEGADSLGSNLAVGADAYLAQIDGLTYGTNPRAGYFDGATFYHPELAFQFHVPEDWQKQNLRSAVRAVSPANDAALELTLSEHGVETAAREFLSQPGLVETSSDRTRINGLDAIVSGFEATGQNGTVQGIVAHIGHAGATYRLVTYAAPAAFAARRAVLGDIVESFAPVTDRDVISVDARRLEIVEIDRAMTLGEFSSRYPSEVPIEELAVINQVSGAEARLGADTEVKRVI